MATEHEWMTFVHSPKKDGKLNGFIMCMRCSSVTWFCNQDPDKVPFEGITQLSCDDYLVKMVMES